MDFGWPRMDDSSTDDETLGGIVGKRERVQRFAVTALLLGSLAAAGLPSSASADDRYISGVNYQSYPDGPGLRATALLSTEHDGVMKVSLFKRVNGKWKWVKTKQAQQNDVSPTAYTANFATPNATKCQFRAKFTTPEHPVSKKKSDAFYCDSY